MKMRITWKTCILASTVTLLAASVSATAAPLSADHLLSPDAVTIQVKGGHGRGHGGWHGNRGKHRGWYIGRHRGWSHSRRRHFW